MPGWVSGRAEGQNYYSLVYLPYCALEHARHIDFSHRRKIVVLFDCHFVVGIAFSGRCILADFAAHLRSSSCVLWRNLRGLSHLLPRSSTALGIGFAANQGGFCFFHADVFFVTRLILTAVKHHAAWRPVWSAPSPAATIAGRRSIWSSSPAPRHLTWKRAPNWRNNCSENSTAAARCCRSPVCPANRQA